MSGTGPASLVEFETDRLRLLRWQERHVAPFAAMNADPEVMRWFPALPDGSPLRRHCLYTLARGSWHGE